MDPLKDHGFGFPPGPADFEAAWDVLEWQIWGPYETVE